MILGDMEEGRILIRKTRSLTPCHPLPRGVLWFTSPKLPEDFFQEAKLSYVKKTWSQWLGRLVPGLQSFDIEIGELRPQIVDLITQTKHAIDRHRR